jgi:adenylate kinase family enzyme
VPTIPRGLEKQATTDEEIFLECKERLRIAVEAENENRAKGVEAIAFRDGLQWPDDLYNQRKIDKRPSLTINHTNTFVRRVVNNMRQERPRIKVHPVGDGADVAKAQVIAGLIRHIENISNASIAYDTGGESAVTIGWGYWRVMTDYVKGDSFDQELKIVPIRNTFTVYLDPTSVMPAGEDADWAVITYKMKRQDYKRAYPDADNIEFLRTGNGDEMSEWETKDEIRLAEYYRVRKDNDTLYMMSNGMTMFADQIEQLAADLKAAKVTYAMQAGKKISRPSTRRTIEWYRLNGQKVVDKRTKGNDPLPDQWIPIIRCEGNVIDLNGRVRRKGMVADLMDPARMYNYWRTMETELLALAPKAPFIVAAGQLDGHPEWKDANQKPYSALVYEPAFLEQPDGSKQLLPPPTRMPPVPVPAGAVQAAQGAQMDLMAVAGMPHDPVADVPGAVVSGIALQRRQALSDIGHYQYYDNQTRAIAHTGKILLQLIPFYYSMPRMQRIIGEDGVPQMVGINQPAPSPSADAMTQIINDMTIGVYDVVMDTGPGYETKRLEGAESMVELLKTPLAEPIVKVGSDIVVRNMDFAGASDLADRLAPMSPQGMAKQIQNLPKEAQAIVQSLQQQNQQLSTQLQHMQLELKYKSAIEHGWQQVEREKILSKSHDTQVKAETAVTDTHVKAMTSRDVAEINAAGRILDTHASAMHNERAAEEMLRDADVAAHTNEGIEEDDQRQISEALSKRGHKATPDLVRKVHDFHRSLNGG